MNNETPEYTAGREAYRAGEARQSNPNDTGSYTQGAAEWYAGYDDARCDDLP